MSVLFLDTRTYGVGSFPLVNHFEPSIMRAPLYSTWYCGFAFFLEGGGGSSPVFQALKKGIVYNVSPEAVTSEGSVPRQVEWEGTS